jgi:DNA-binding transcriptional regulator YhcF (GntR family)
MDFLLNRNSGVPLHDQLLAQLEMKILCGGIAPGQRLPSVRVLARKLGLHANTVSGAYRELEKAGHVELRRGAGVFVRAQAAASVEDARGLDEMIRVALNTAARKGHSGAEIRAAVERWLRAAPPERVVVVDPRRETIELMVHELQAALGVPVAGCTLEELASNACLLSGALALALPYHSGKIGRLVPGALVKTVHVHAWAADRDALAALPAGASVLIVSRSPMVLQFAVALAGSVRGDELLVEARAACSDEWQRMLPGADLVFADVLSAPLVRRARPRRFQELHLIGQEDLERVRRAFGSSLTRP